MVAAVTAAAGCQELHCFEEHGFDTQIRDAALRQTLDELFEAYHRTHDTRYPRALCGDTTCREVWAVLALR